MPTYEPGRCGYCKRPLPVPRNPRRLYCEQACGLRASKPRHKVRKKADPETVRMVLELVATSRLAPCMDCKGSFPPVCMDFDHRDPSTKSFALSRARGFDLEAVKLELAKCDLICSNCHRIRTHITRRQP